MRNFLVHFQIHCAVNLLAYNYATVSLDENLPNMEAYLYKNWSNIFFVDLPASTLFNDMIAHNPVITL